jgi:hypothetical protein
MNELFLNVDQAAEKLGVTARTVRRKCEGGKLPGSIREGRSWSIPLAADPKLMAIPSRDTFDEVLIKGVAAGKREAAINRLGIIKQFEVFAAGYVRQGGNRSDAIKVFAGQADVPRTTLYRWIQRYSDQGLLGLVDSRGGGRSGDVVSPDAFEFFKSLYLTQQRKTIKSCWRDTIYMANSEKEDWTVPPYAAMARYVQKAIPYAVQVLYREGIAAYEAKCSPYILTDPDSVEPGQVWIGDHHKCNCFIRHRNKWIRPWVTAWMDMRSRTMVGWDVNAGPNQVTIMQAFKRAAQEFGPPDSVKIDNGKDYDSEMWTGTTKLRRRKAAAAGYIDEKTAAGLYAMMDVGVSFSIPYHPQSKAIERFFDTLDIQIITSMTTYCGKDSTRVPDDLNNKFKSERFIDKAMGLEDFASLIGKYMAVYNTNSHTGRGMDGRSPNEVMSTRTSKRVLAAGVLDLVARCWSGELKIGKNGVKFNKMWYGQFDMDLLVNQDRMARVAYDPDDLRTVNVYDAVTMKLIAEASQAELIGYGDKVSEEALREAMRHKANTVKVLKAYRDKSQTANMDIPALTIKAMAAGAKESRSKDSNITAVKPVSTPFDRQVKEHERRLFKKAVGSGLTEELDFDLDAMCKQKHEGSSVKLFDE